MVVVIVAVVVRVFQAAVGTPVAMAGVGMVVGFGGMGVVTRTAMVIGGIVRSVSPVRVRQLLPRRRCGSMVRSAMRNGRRDGLQLQRVAITLSDALRVCPPCACTSRYSALMRALTFKLNDRMPPLALPERVPAIRGA